MRFIPKKDRVKMTLQIKENEKNDKDNLKHKYFGEKRNPNKKQK